MPLLEAWVPTASVDRLIRRGRPDRFLDGFVLDITKPVRSNSGLQGANGGQGVTEAQLANYAGSFTNVAAGETLSRLAITSPVTPTAANITLKESKVMGPATGTGTLIDCSSAGCVGFRYEFCDVRPQSADNDTVCVVGHDYTGYRNDVSGGVDGHRPRNTNGGMGSAPLNVQILGEHIHSLFMKSPNAAHSDNLSHTDCIQVEGGTGIIVRGCNLESYLDPTRGQASVDGTWDNTNARATGDGNPFYPDLQGLSCFLISPNVGNCDGFQLLYNWMSGGIAKINIGAGTSGRTADNGIIRGNRYARDGLDTTKYRSGGTDWTSRPITWGGTLGAQARDSATLDANTWMDTGLVAA